ncbi:hypothetical protein DACRYDRAFT_19710 [Dacryopinax primogenitus]|uniref:NADAR domain-containing protein n=1 Tax=Dacryopinax primogenitus (strain DJM 731) TaxID=1858805 RepID=M5G8V9_DACPD|nr:uncharacterized protein DACRYDRAFT_19710 [Dacryopinax primogenitus]EJU06646.1 hypothetical protein DACRYDRAFT_19710 [Dacryopinax primogenitus]
MSAPNTPPFPAAPAYRRRSYVPPSISPAVVPSAWQPSSSSYPPPTPMAPLMHTVPLPAETPRPFSPRGLPSPALTSTPPPMGGMFSPRSAPAVLPFPGGYPWPQAQAPAVLPTPAAYGRAQPAPIPIPMGRRPAHGRGLTLVQPSPPCHASPASASASEPRFRSSGQSSPLSIPTDVDRDNTLVIPSSPTTQAAIRRSHAAISMALNSAHPVLYAGRRYLTAEHLLEAMKFKYHPEAAEQVRRSQHPRRTAEQLGQYVRLDWESRKAAKVQEVVRLKHLQNPELVEELLETGNSCLVDESDPQMNHLGGALMRLRWEYQPSGADSLG